MEVGDRVRDKDYGVCATVQVLDGSGCVVEYDDEPGTWVSTDAANFEAVTET